MAAPVFRAAPVTATGSGTTTSRTVTVPATAQVGDLLVLIGMSYNTGATFLAPTGISGFVERLNIAGNLGTSALAIWTKVVGPGDAGTVITASTTLSRSKSVVLLTYAQADYNAITAAVNTAASTGAYSTSVPSPAVTPTVADTTILDIIAMFNVATSATVAAQTTPPTNYTERVDLVSTEAGTVSRGLLVVNDRQLVGGSGVAQTPGVATMNIPQGWLSATMSIVTAVVADVAAFTQTAYSEIDATASNVDTTLVEASAHGVVITEPTTDVYRVAHPVPFTTDLVLTLTAGTDSETITITPGGAATPKPKVRVGGVWV